MSLEKIPRLTVEFTLPSTDELIIEDADFRNKVNAKLQWCNVNTEEHFALVTQLNNFFNIFNSAIDFIEPATVNIENAKIFVESTVNSNFITDPWNNTTDYSNTIIAHNGKIWRSLVTPNVGNQPQDNSLFWANLSAMLKGDSADIVIMQSPEKVVLADNDFSVLNDSTDANKAKKFNLSNLYNFIFEKLKLSLMPVGGIIIWNGTISTIPNKWYLCNGENGTPNLVDRFIMGADSNSVALIGGSPNAVVASHDHDVTVSVSGRHGHHAWTGDGGWHGHDLTTYFDMGNDMPFRVTGSDGSYYDYTMFNVSGVEWSGNHGHGVGVAENGEHGHEVDVKPSGESGIGKNLPPFYALAYIMYKGV